MIGTIGFENYQIECIVGINPQERVEAQKIYVDFKAEADVSKSVLSDDIRDTIDYFSAARLCADVARKENYFLLEKLAYDMLQEIAKQLNISWGWIRLKKPHPFPLVDCAFVELEYGKSRLK